MGYYHGTYAFFGVHIPREQYQAHGDIRSETEWLDAVIRKTPELSGHGLGHIRAGDYDRDELFVCVDDPDDRKGAEIPLGQFRVLNPEVPITWTALLQRLVREAGYDDSEIQPPAWIVVPNLS